MKNPFVSAFSLGFIVIVMLHEAPAQIETQDFASEESAEAAGWRFNEDAQNPERDCDDCATDLGFKSSNIAGGAVAGEGGGLLHRSGTLPIGFYGDLLIGTLNWDMPIMASGKVALVNTNFDGHAHLGFFDGERLSQDPLDFGADMGFLIAEPGGGVAPNFRWGPSIQSDTGSSIRNNGTFVTGIPDSEPLDFLIEYDPEGAPFGLLTLTIGDDEPTEVELTEELREAGASLTAFGIFTGPYTGSADSRSMEMFIDDIAYTSLVADFTAGDFNDDGKVDLVDFGILADNFDTGSTFAQGDNNFDGRVDLRDFAQFRQIFNSQGVGAATAVPEPNNLITIGLGLVSLVAARRRRRPLR